MKIFKILLFALVMMMSVASCKTFKVLPSSNTTKTDSTFTTKTRKDIDTLQVVREADSAKVSADPNKLTSTPKVVKSKHATVSLSKINGKIKADCKCDGLEEMVKLQWEIIETYREINKSTENNTVIQESWWMGWLKPFLPFLIMAGVLILLKDKFLNSKNTR